MTYKQRLKKARELLDQGRPSEAARHIAAAQKKKELSYAELADELDTSKGWVRDFLGQHRYVTAEPIKDPPKKRKSTKAAKARSQAAKKAARTRKRKAAQKKSAKPARKKSAAEKAVTKTVKATIKKATPKKPPSRKTPAKKPPSRRTTPFWERKSPPSTSSKPKSGSKKS